MSDAAGAADYNLNALIRLFFSSPDIIIKASVRICALISAGSNGRLSGPGSFGDCGGLLNNSIIAVLSLIHM